MRACCRCNRGGRCRNCACVKNGDQCTGCLPGRLGKCENGASDTYDADNSHHDADNSYHSVPTTTIVYQPHVDVDVDALAMTPLASLRTVEGDDFTDEAMTNEDEPIRPFEEPPTPMTDPLNPEPICLSEGEQTSISREGDNTLHHTLMTPPTPTPIDDLPPFEPGAPQNYRWGDTNSELFTSSIHRCYKEVVHWKRNLFKIPSGKSGKSFVQELARFFHTYADKSALEAIALEAAMVLPALILQKSHPNSKVKEHTAQLERRLKAWKDGNLEELLHESRTIQSKFSRSHQPRGKLSEQLARSFANLMMEG